MRKMKDSGIAWIGEIPDDWGVERIKNNLRRRTIRERSDCEVLSLYREYGVLPKNSRDDNHNVTSEDTSKYLFVRKGDFVVNKMKAWQGSVGFSQYEGIVSPAYYVYAFISKKYNGMFFHYLLRGCYKDEFRRLSGGIREGQWDLPACEFENTLVILPSLAEQQRIADYLDAQCAKIDSTIAKTQQIIEKLKAYKQSVIAEAVTKGLNPDAPMKDSGIEWIGKMPSHWGVCKFGVVASVKSNLVSPEKYPELPQVSPENIEKGSGKILPCQTVEESGVISWNHLFYKGQILYSKIRPRLNKVTIAPFDGLCSADMYPIETSQDYDFIKYMMLADSFVEQVILVTENRVKMPKINQNELGQILVCIPNIDEQKQIASYLDDKCARIDGYITKKQEVIEKLTAYKKSLIFEVVTGKKEI